MMCDANAVPIGSQLVQQLIQQGEQLRPCTADRDQLRAAPFSNSRFQGVVGQFVSDQQLQLEQQQKQQQELQRPQRELNQQLTWLLAQKIMDAQKNQPPIFVRGNPALQQQRMERARQLQQQIMNQLNQDLQQNPQQVQQELLQLQQRQQEAQKKLEEMRARRPLRSSRDLATDPGAGQYAMTTSYETAPAPAIAVVLIVVGGLFAFALVAINVILAQKLRN